MKNSALIKIFGKAAAGLLAMLMLAACAFAALPAYARSGAGAALIAEDPDEARNREISETLFPAAQRGGAAIKGVTMNNDVNMDFSNIRVLISISKQFTVSEIELYLTGEYYFTSDMRVLSGMEEPYYLKIAKVGGMVYAYDSEGNELTHGESLELRRVYVSYTAGCAQLHTEGCYGTSSTYGTDGNRYLGNFLFDTKDSGNLRMINTVPMAHYIYGVIEHEMSYLKKPEALKAQAVAAKCYGMCFMSGTDDFDVQDGYKNSTYQLYRGFSTDPGKMTLLPICFSVIGEALSYNERIIPTFYGASDGGETTLPSYVFNAEDTRYDGAYGIVHDEVDFAASDRRRTITVTYGAPNPTDEYSSRFLDFILYKARELDGGQYNRVVSIELMYAHDPYGNTTRDMRRVYVKATVTDGVMEGPLQVELDFPSKELKTVHLTDLDGSGDSYTSSKPGVFYASYNIYWGEATANGYKLYYCRHGNGIGLSQHGAAAMAEPQYGSRDHYYILSFYYPNFEQITVTEDDPEAPLLATLRAAAYGRCVAANAELYSEPDIENGTVLSDVELEEHLDIITVTPDGCWYLVLCGGHMGYIYYTKVMVDMFPAAPDAVYTVYDGTIGANTSLYSAPTLFSDHAELEPGTAFTVWAQIGLWYYVVAETGEAGYMPMYAAVVGEPYEVSGAEPIVSAAGEPYYLTSLDYDISKPIHGGRRIG